MTVRWASLFRINWTATHWGRWILTTGAAYFYMASVLISTSIVTPAAIHYLGVREYGLWAIANQLIIYVKLLDFGLSRSMQRLVAEAMIEDNRDGSRRYTLLWFFCGVMSVILFAIGLLLCRVGLRYLNVPPDLMGTGTILFVGLLGIFCLGYFFAPASGIIYAQNRIYLSGFFDTLAIWLNMGLFLLFLHRGDGLLSYLYASLITAPICLTIGLAMVFTGPPTPKFNFSIPTWLDFREVFGFSGGIFVNGIISQFQLTFPILLVSHYAGLAAAGRFYLGWRLATFLYHFVLQPSESLMPRWQNMYLHGNLERLRHEFSETLILLTQMALVAATCFAAGLKPLLLLWMGPLMYDGSTLTIAFSLYVAVYVIASFIPKPFMWAKAYLRLTVPLLAELLFILPICMWVIKTNGVGPMLLAAVGGTAFITVGYYGIWGPPLLKMKTYTEAWGSRDFTVILIQLAGLAGTLAAIIAMDRHGVSRATEFIIGLLISAGAILFLFYSQGPRLKRVYKERRKQSSLPSPAVVAMT